MMPFGAAARRRSPQADMSTLATRLLAPFGVEVMDIDLRRARDAATIAAVRGTWQRNGIALFRGQQLAEADLVRFSACFGSLETHVRREYLSRQHPEVLLISNLRRDGRPIGILGDHEVGWHHDQSYLERPALGSLLYAVELPPTGGDTSFANLADAYDALPESMKRRLHGLRAVHSYAFFNGSWSEPASAEQRARTPEVTHPVVRTHPETGRRALYVDPGMTPVIEGLPAHESRALLDELFAWCTRPEFVYVHRWQPGDALLWDNASTMHRRGEFDPAHRRLMKRTTILAPPDRAVPA
jgi:taurine dioxygenase